MTYAELSEAQARRSRQFAEAQSDVMSVYCYAERDLKDLQAENDRLRKLVADMWRELDAATQYDAGGSRGVVFEYRDTMRKLGIEVDE